AGGGSPLGGGGSGGAGGGNSFIGGGGAPGGTSTVGGDGNDTIGGGGAALGGAILLRAGALTTAHSAISAHPGIAGTRAKPSPGLASGSALFAFGAQYTLTSTPIAGNTGTAVANVSVTGTLGNTILADTKDGDDCVAAATTLTASSVNLIETIGNCVVGAEDL